MNTSTSECLLAIARKRFHGNIVSRILKIKNGVPSNADSSQKSSIAIARSIAEELGALDGDRHAGHTSEDQFEQIVAEFINDSFIKLDHIRPGKWNVEQVKGRTPLEIAKDAQYSHLESLRNEVAENHDLAGALGNDYSIAPDVVIWRALQSDDELNQASPLVDDQVGIRADLRDFPGKRALLHACISTKWALCSGRAQKARSEVLNLLRNRKGRQPHIIAVTAEPTPSRLSSLALGAGDIDCLYHFALDELKRGVAKLANDEAQNMLDSMIESKRLKDISDLPLDLAV